jgi:hypothetical protein
METLLVAFNLRRFPRQDIAPHFEGYLGEHTSFYPAETRQLSGTFLLRGSSSRKPKGMLSIIAQLFFRLIGHPQQLIGAIAPLTLDFRGRSLHPTPVISKSTTCTQPGRRKQPLCLERTTRLPVHLASRWTVSPLPFTASAIRKVNTCAS